MKKIFDFSTDKRKKARNGFEKDFFKLMNNNVYGKMMENLIKRVNVRLVRDARYCKKKRACRQTLVYQKILTKIWLLLMILNQF